MSSEFAVRTTLLYVVQLGLGLFWIAAALAKLRAPRPAEDTIRRVLYPRGGRWADRAPVLLCRLLVAAEIILGLLLLSGWQARTAALVGAAMLLGFVGALAADAVARSRAAGSVGGCGCFGSVPAAASPATSRGNPGLGAAIARNLMLAIVSLGVAGGVHGPCGCAEAPEGRTIAGEFKFANARALNPVGSQIKGGHSRP